jgi:hypothetical protein
VKERKKFAKNNLLAVIVSGQLHRMFNHLLANTTSFVRRFNTANFNEHHLLGAGKELLEFGPQQFGKNVHFFSGS